VSCAKTDKLIEMPFGELTCMSPRKHVDDGQDRTRGDKSAMRPFAKLLWPLCCVKGNRIWMWNCGRPTATLTSSDKLDGVGGAVRHGIAHERMRHLTCDRE